jgi:hypothetical protein
MSTMGGMPGLNVLLTPTGDRERLGIGPALREPATGVGEMGPTMGSGADGLAIGGWGTHAVVGTRGDGAAVSVQTAMERGMA